MRTLVLSGGGNRGAMQVGALQALNEAEIKFDMVIGTSAGALNGAWYCLDPKGIDKLANLWINTKREDVWPGNYLIWALRILFGKTGLVSYAHLERYIRRHLKESFGLDELRKEDFKIPFYMTTVDIKSGFIYLYQEGILPLVASASMPLISEPVPFKNRLLTDGGLNSPLPLEIAKNLGASEIYGVNLLPSVYDYTPKNIGEMIVSSLLASNLELALDDLRDIKTVPFCHIRLPELSDVNIMDFSQAKEMIKVGYEKTKSILSGTSR